MSNTISTGRDPDEGTVPWYNRMYQNCKIDDGYENSVKKSGELVLEGRYRYERVSALTGVPWWVIGIIHYKEGSCNFKACMANGERIIGTGRKTTLVPKGLGPWNTWEEAAVYAIKHSSLAKITDWSVGNTLYAVERYNGAGYISGKGKEDTSPYLWARTNVNDDFGKYVRDGNYDPRQSTNQTSGFCAIMKVLDIA